ncbi:MAG: VWA domain-containing protein [Phycisphaerales bacterium]|nr:VWA domain-containing protein [Phycisphaerales bacterium]
MRRARIVLGVVSFTALMAALVACSVGNSEYGKLYDTNRATTMGDARLEQERAAAAEAMAGNAEFDLYMSGRVSGVHAETPPANPSGGLASPSAKMRVLTEEDLARYSEAIKRRRLGIGGDADRPPVRAGDGPYVSSSTEELWIIERRTTTRARPEDDVPGSGSLVCWPAGQPTEWGKQVAVPLRHTDVSGSIAGYISSVTVTQTFTNPYDSKIEAVYAFPLPENAAVSDFVMTIGERKIRGIIRERQEAQQIYNAARAQGHVASLLTQERPNIFTQRVANIEPGRAIDVSMTYYSTLTYRDGGYEWVFPMVIGPRFNPPGTPGTTDGIGAVGRGAGGASGQSTEVQYLRPGERSGSDISLALDIDAGVRIRSIESPTHRVEIDRPGGSSSQARVRLARSDSIPNKDFILRYTVAGEAVETALVTHRDSRGGYFTLMLVPPKDLSRLERGPVEMVFVVDCSGSMQGRPIEQARAAVEAGLSKLRDEDTFQILDFAESVSGLGRYPMAATSANIRQGRSYVRSLNAGGGTYMINGMRAALGFPKDGERLRFVAFLTDGFIGNEGEILRELDQGLGDSRIFGLGIGSSPNRYLMDEMSRMGRGAVSYAGPGDKTDEVMDSFFDAVSKAALTNLEVDWGAANVTEIYPSRPPDLFVGRPVLITGRFEGEFSRPITVRGRAGGKPREFTVPVGGSTSVAAARTLPQVWARMKIADLARQQIAGRGDTTGGIRQLALDYSLMSSYTAFIAVDSASRTAGDFGTTVSVPVPVPEGVKYDTTVQEGRTVDRPGGF